MADKKGTPPKKSVPAGAAGKNTAASKDKQPPKKSFGLFKLLLGVLILIMLGGAGFASGVYLNLIDLNKLAGDYKLHQYPIVGKYFPKPPELPPDDIETNESSDLPASVVQPPLVQPPGPAEPLLANPTPVVPGISDAEKEKLEKARQQEENKRISKMARLYGAMKPEEAVPILNQLEDDMVITIFSKMEDEQVAKLLALMDNKRAAKLTQTMVKGK